MVLGWRWCCLKWRSSSMLGSDWEEIQDLERWGLSACLEPRCPSRRGGGWEREVWGRTANRPAAFLKESSVRVKSCFPPTEGRHGSMELQRTTLVHRPVNHTHYLKRLINTVNSGWAADERGQFRISPAAAPHRPARVLTLCLRWRVASTTAESATFMHCTATLVNKSFLWVSAAARKGKHWSNSQFLENKVSSSSLQPHTHTHTNSEHIQQAASYTTGWLWPTHTYLNRKTIPRHQEPV